MKSEDVEKTFDPLCENFKNSDPYVQKRFIASPIDVLCSNFVKFGLWEIGKIVGCLPDKIFRLAVQSRPISSYYADRAQNL